MLESMKEKNRVGQALTMALRFGGIDGDHHKAWVIDQMVRALTGCKFDKSDTCLDDSEEYLQFVKDAKDGDDGPDTYDWNEGIAP